MTGTIPAESVAQDQLRAFVERVERIEEEIKALNDDKREIYAEAKGNGFDTKAIKIVIKERRQDYGERMELEAVLDLYRAALGMAVSPREDDEDPARAPAPARTREIIEEFDAERGEILNAESRPADAPVATEADGPSGDNARQQFEPLSGPPAAQEDGDLTVAANSSSGRTESSADGQTNSPAWASEGPVVGLPETAQMGPQAVIREEEPARRSPATNSSETATESLDDLAVQDGLKMSSDRKPSSGLCSEGTNAAPDPGVTGRRDGHTNSPATEPGTEPAGGPAIAGATTFERTPPRPVSRHAFNRCWPDRWGMPLAIFADDVREHGIQKPIVKIGDEILDGWCRYTVARDIGVEYPVVQYQGSDPLADSIRMNLEVGGRLLTLHEQKQIAAKLAKVPGNEHRASEILELFGFKAEEKAA